MTKLSYCEPTSEAYKNLIKLYKYDGIIDLNTFKNKLFEMIEKDLENDFIKFDDKIKKQIKNHFLLINII